MYHIAAIIPAYNEEKTIRKVILATKKVDLIDEIIVVSDGSKDKTAEIAKSLQVEVTDLKKNIGKGGAIKKGADKSQSDILLFLDADLIGLTPKHITDLLKPVITGYFDVSIGVFNNGRKITDLGQKLTPFLSGQRVLKKYILQDISNLDITQYGVELALTKYIMKNNIKYKNVFLSNLTHVMKEEKLGFFKGFIARIKMYFDIVKAIS